ncbi:uncharacterized protein LOC142635581 [Castanea sativa]|uniref:uncharacterized protein LOC142635581 n=1 Tax=Castanea sativa TaxID=21020 RepID=UPI003F64A19C
MSDASGRSHFDRRDQELEQRDQKLERLCMAVRDLELQARGRRRRKDQGERRERSVSVGNHCEAGSLQSGSRRHRDHSREDIESAPMSSWFARPPFNSYTGKTDSMEHEFGVRFMTYSWVPQPMDALLSIKMGAGETLRNYANRYWELYNEIGGGNGKIATSTFRMGLPEESGLRESLTLKPPKDMRQLMRRIEEYKRLKDDRLQSKGKEAIIGYPQNNGFNPRHRKDLRIQESDPMAERVNATFKEPVHRIIDRIKNESYFKQPNRMAGDPSRRNQNLYCTYHRDKGHTTEQCRMLKDHLEQLVKAGHLKEFLVETGNQETGQADRLHRNPLPPPLGVIEVIPPHQGQLEHPQQKGC